MKNESETIAAPVAANETTLRLVLILGLIYRVAVVGGAGVLVWHGGSPWVLVAAVPLMFFAPKLNR